MHYYLGMVFDIHMPCAGWRLLRHSHHNTCIIILVENRSGFLGNADIPEYTLDERYQWTKVRSTHKLCLCARLCHCGLDLGLVSNSPTSKAITYTSKRPMFLWLWAGSPIRIDTSVEVRAGMDQANIKEQVMCLAVDVW